MRKNEIRGTSESVGVSTRRKIDQCLRKKNVWVVQSSVSDHGGRFIRELSSV
jgi:hypothetical protein